jgi:predicted acylesterase/phospholipase RssA
MTKCCKQIILRGEAALRAKTKIPDPVECLKLAKELKACQAFSWSRRLLMKLRADWPAFRKDYVTQQLVHCTYSDPDLSRDFRLNQAEEAIKTLLEPVLDEWTALKNVEHPITKETHDRIDAAQETLAFAAAIHKRKWDLEGQTRELLKSVAYYRRAFELKLPDKAGYTGVNAAFIDDLLAHRVKDDLKKSELPLVGVQPAQQYLASLEQEATTIRDEVIKMLSAMTPEDRDNNWWHLVTIAEAYFGLKDYLNAKDWASRARKVAALKSIDDPIAPWQKETTLRQFGRLASLQGAAAQCTDAQAVLHELADRAPLDGVDLGFTGKVGLALSGGGFRASLYHIGVLAALAERDLLRHVEVLSCVSGGSIIGALYYLKVRELLESTPEVDIKCNHYIKLIQGIEKTFVNFVKSNPRMQTFTRPDYWGLWLGDLLLRKRIPAPPFARILDRKLYRPAIADPAKEPQPNDLCLRSLIVKPRCDEGFKPKYENWRRKDKVPILVLNATTLNTCHNWQFTCTWMGESPAAINPEIDANDRLRRPYYDECKPPLNIRLGLAVAASACVPGIFYPIKIGNFYKKDYTVRLVDGGVYDNQGIASLLEQDCSVLLVSDASGQNATDKDPGILRLSVLTRSGNVQGGRVRSEEFERLRQLKRASVLRGLAFVHLKKELGVTPVDWQGCSDPKEGQIEGGKSVDDPVPTSYHVRAALQNSIAAIRTDLDCFNETEAKCLMASGYLMMQKELEKSANDKNVSCICKLPLTWWQFRAAVPILENPPSDDVKVTLDIGKERFFKFLRFSKPLRSLFELFRAHGWIKATTAIAFGVICWFLVCSYPWIFLWTLVGLGIATFFGPLYWLSLLVDQIYLRQGRLP